jgi:hypothetical protein
MRALTAMLMLALCSLASAQQIPPGTVLPVMLNSSLDARRAKPGEPISGNIMQDVPLPDGWKISKGSKVLGHVVSTSPATPGSPSRLAFVFDRLKTAVGEIPITTHLRALASPHQVFEAKLPTNSIDDYGTSTSDWNTIQIGGAGVYRGNGEVVQGNSVVGHTTDYGAVTAKLVPSPQDGCGGGGQREQALWLFSPWACGVYGYSDVKIVRHGDADQPGVIELESPDNIRVDGGSGWLLRMNGSD